MIPLRVLLIEDSEIDASLVLRHLEKAGYGVTALRVEDEPELKNALEQQWDIIIADFQLPSFNAPGALAVLQETGKDIPFIVVSGAVGEEAAVSLMKSGARDYVMKNNLSKLPAVVERELLEFNIRQSQKQSHEALLESERNLKNSQSVAKIGHWVNDLIQKKDIWSDEMYRIFGVDLTNENRKFLYFLENLLHPEDKVIIQKLAHDLHNNLPVGDVECRIIRPDGSIRYLLIRPGESEFDKNGSLIRSSGVVHDITDRKFIELDLRDKVIESRNRAQQLETITYISSRMRQANSRQELVRIILEEMAKLLQADHAAIAFLEGEFLVTDILLSGGNVIPVNTKEKIGKQVREILDERRTGFIEKIHPHAFQELPAWLYGNGPRPASMISCPIINKDIPVGLFYMDFISPRIFTDEQQVLVSTILDMAGNALNRMAATQDLEAMVSLRERELESIYAVTSSASATLDINQALRRALELTLEAVHTKSGAIFLVQEKTSKFDLITFKLVNFIPDGFLNKAVVKQSLEKIIQQKKPLVIPNLDQIETNEATQLSPSELSLIGLPMRAQDRVVGVLMVINKSSDLFILKEMTLLSFIADHLALVVENSRSYKRAKNVAVLEERSRLARELHDSVTQSLYSASLYSAGARRFFGQKKYLEVDSYLSQIGDLTQQALKDMRLLVYELRSPELKQNGLLGSLQNRLDSVERRSNIQAEIHMDYTEALPEIIEENLYRIAIEALNNSLKYAQATKVVVEMNKVDDEMIFIVQDNGVGFSIEEGMLNGGMGLATMHERAKRINGTYQVSSSSVNGTKTEVRFSIKTLS
jgi:signal transduction histidine kinase/DNA-binding response OmpR family regulator